MDRPDDSAAAQRLAERVRDTMFATDRAAHALGMTVTEVGPGSASVAMTVRADMLNGFGICQGGLIATLADMAFAYACNSYNELTVASGFDVDLLGPGREGDRLTARGRVVSQGARMGVYDIEVSNQTGERIAVFRGRSYRMKGKQVAPA
ncbi:MAG: hydroxyphenylacetyl-CoA thioesterase PaaI [Piscinibacter sp.]|nr:hydroxyphenylacetyl-CoA thioesterase PaaI [Piscinibacter sp.]